MERQGMDLTSYDDLKQYAPTWDSDTCADPVIMSCTIPRKGKLGSLRCKFALFENVMNN